jgi:isopentenyl-diphosphate delta-isomerase
MEKRKKDHIDLAFQAQVSRFGIDDRFHYEPMLSPHLQEGLAPIHFLNRTFRAPIWISSMTGGAVLAHTINHNLARVCHEFGLGMGLGSCRILLNNDKHLPDFDVRNIIGRDQPLYANLGIAQMEQFYKKDNPEKVKQLLNKLHADGLIIHVNPIQESLQPEGDRFTVAPIEVIEWSLRVLDAPLIVKEVGQGMGPTSLKNLLQLPLAAIEFGAFGGTNFSKLELMRCSAMEQESYRPLTFIGHDAIQMVEMVNSALEEITPACKQIIVSGGVKSFLDGYYLIHKLTLPAIYGQASSFLTYAMKSYDQLKKFTEYQIRGLELATAFLRVK